MPPEDSPHIPGGPPRLVCRCIGVSSTRIIAAIQDGGLDQLRQIQDSVRAGTGCGTCHPEIEEILAELSGQSVSKLDHMQNRMICRAETERRVEGSLFGGIVPHLPEGTRVELVSVEGLRVDLHLSPPEPSLQKQIRDKLCKFVCSELEIIFS